MKATITIIPLLIMSLLISVLFFSVKDCNDCSQDAAHAYAYDESTEESQTETSYLKIDMTPEFKKASIDTYKVYNDVMYDDSIQQEIEDVKATTEQTDEKPISTKPVNNIQTTKPISTTKPASTTTQVNTVTQTTAQTTTEVQTTTAPQSQTPSSNSWKNEIVKVYDIRTGTIVSKNAFDIVCESTYNEIGTSFHTEAIKAQALVIYSYIKASNNIGQTPSLSLKPNPPSKITECAAAVDGLGIYYNSKMALTTFCASTGGGTANSKDVWGAYYPYLKSVESKYDNQDPYYGRTLTVSVDEMRSIIEKNTDITLSSDPSQWFTFLSASQGGVLDGGYVGKMLIDGNSTYNNYGKTYYITGKNMRERILGMSKLKSANFNITYQNNSFVITTYGYGHGVGMSQYGANLYAKNEGYTFKQIITHYYQGVTIA